MNKVFLRGRLRSPAQQRVLDSGTVIVNYEVTVVRDDGPADSVPVMWQDPPVSAHADELDAGVEIVVIGRVRRRFFRAGGATQSRTEVVVETLIPATRARRVAKAIDDHVAELCEAEGVA